MRPNDLTTQLRRVLVYAANGVQGSAIARALNEEGFRVRACLRDRSKAALLGGAMEIAVADLDDRTALRAAHRGIEAAVLTVPRSCERERLLRWTRHAAEAARDARVRLVVLNLGSRVPDPPCEIPTYELRRECEAVLRSFGPATITLRPPMFMENLLAVWVREGVRRERALCLPLAAQMRVSWLSVADLGAYAAAALRRPDLAGSTFDIGGPQALDGAALAQSLALQPDRPLKYCTLSFEQVEQQLSPHLGAEAARRIAFAYAWMARRRNTAFLSGTSALLARELRRVPQTVRAWARERGLLS
jgi:uncharacterized protein YbjT (DUF2867 family)